MASRSLSPAFLRRSLTKKRVAFGPVAVLAEKEGKGGGFYDFSPSLLSYRRRRGKLAWRHLWRGGRGEGKEGGRARVPRGLLVLLHSTHCCRSRGSHRSSPCCRWRKGKRGGETIPDMAPDATNQSIILLLFLCYRGVSGIRSSGRFRRP